MENFIVLTGSSSFLRAQKCYRILGYYILKSVEDLGDAMDIVVSLLLRTYYIGYIPSRR